MPPRVTAIVPARNEEANIAACVRSLLAQDTDLEVWVADDGSSDGTAQVVQCLAADDRRVRLLTVPPLPAGWVGKNHALDFAARQAGSDWLLFTDADTVHEPGSLRACLDRAGREGLALLSLSPGQQAERWFEKAVIPRVFQALERLYRFDEINDPSKAAAAANGQYILISADAYRQAGGHDALRAEILEDVALARSVKQSGRRIFFGSGRGLVRTRMYRDFAALWQGWSKNLFLLYGSRPARVAAAAAWVLVADVLPLPLAAVFPLPALLWLAARHAYYGVRLRRQGENPRLVAYYWPGSALFSALLLASLIKYVLHRPVAWKGRAYAASAASR